MPESKLECCCGFTLVVVSDWTVKYYLDHLRLCARVLPGINAWAERMLAGSDLSARVGIHNFTEGLHSQCVN